MGARIVPPSEREAVWVAIPARGVHRGNTLPALLMGEMVHFDDQRSHFNGRLIRERYGRRLRTRDDGNGGRYYWTEPID